MPATLVKEAESVQLRFIRGVIGLHDSDKGSGVSDEITRAEVGCELLRIHYRAGGTSCSWDTGGASSVPPPAGCSAWSLGSGGMIMSGPPKGTGACGRGGRCGISSACSVPPSARRP